MTHQAPDEILADYASGATAPGLSLLLAAHLTRCPQARRRLGELEEIGGALIADAPPEPLDDAALDRALAAIDAQPVDRARPDVPGAADGLDTAVLPRPLARRVGVPLDRINWRFRLPGLAEHRLRGFPGEHVILLRGRPGARLPRHTHRGLEATLVLQGCLRDDGVDYRPGDVAVHDDSTDHQPQIVGPETCYCLLVLDAPMRFTGPLSRVFNLFVR